LRIPKCSETHYAMTIGNFNSQLGIPKCPETHREMTIGNFNSQLGIPKCSETHHEMTIGNFDSHLGIPKCSETHHEMTIGNFNSQLGIPKCSETHYEMTIGNFNSQLGIPKLSETHHEMTIGNFTPFGELNLYKRNGVGRPPGDRLPGCLCWQISIVGAKASTWGDAPPPSLSPFCLLCLFSLLSMSLFSIFLRGGHGFVCEIYQWQLRSGEPVQRFSAPCPPMVSVLNIDMGRV